MPSSNLPQHLGQLLESHAGADVTFAVSGESFAAHKNILAARSPVFWAEFFGEMEEKTSRRVESQEMEPSVFGALLRFIYTPMWCRSLIRRWSRRRPPWPSICL